VNALANETVGEYVNEHFVTAYQKVGTFRVNLNNGQKQGGNVATYFCLPDGTVLHAVAGPVNAQKFMQEARFAVETHKLAAANARNDPFKYRLTVRASHYDKLKDEGGVLYPPAALPGLRYADTATDEPLRLGLGRRLGNAGKVSALLTAYPLARLETLYPVVWEQVLNEKLSAAPVLTARR
jgi:hypothetical protein